MKQNSEVTPGTEQAAQRGQPTLRLPRKANSGSAAGKRDAAEAALGAITPAERQRLIATTAYYRAERRGFAPGGELEDWCAAEVEIDQRLKHG